MARLSDLFKVADRHNLVIISIKDLINYRLKNESLIKRKDQIKLPTKFGEFKLIAFEQPTPNEVHLAVIK